MKTRRYATSVASTIALTTFLVVASQAAPAVTVSDGWIRALPGGVPAGGYFKLHNAGNEPISLVGASSPACGMLMLHKSETMEGTAQMTDVQSVDVPAGATLAFAPGGYHLMCMMPTAAIRPGGSVPVTLQFAGGQSISANFVVRNAAGR